MPGTPVIPATPVRLSIDMLDATQTCAALTVDADELLALVNQSQLAAYDLGGNIRFRYSDVSALASLLAIAA